MSRKSLLFAGMVMFLLAAGCRKPTKLVLTKDQRMRIARNTLKTAPTPMFKSGAIFGNSIELIGMDVDPKEVKPGGHLKITYYWKCLKPVHGPWKVFVHFELPQGRRMGLDHVPVHELYPIENWKKGEIIRDIQDVTVDRNAKPGMATVWLGLFNVDVYKSQGGGDRMPLSNPAKVTNDGNNRVKGATVRILPKKGGKAVKSAAKPQRIRLTAMRTLKPIVVDGNLDEQDWRTAFYTKPLLQANGNKAAPRDKTIVAAIYDKDYLYIGFRVMDSDIHSTYTHRDDELWKQDDVEVYLDPLQDGKDYIELQVSPANQVFDALFTSHRIPDWHVADKYNIPGLKTAVHLNGTLNNSNDVDVGWDVEIAVPWKALKGIQGAPPAPQTRLTINFFRLNFDKGKMVSALAFSPAGGDFHNLNRAGELVLVGYPTDMLKHAIKATKGMNRERRTPIIKPVMLRNQRVLQHIVNMNRQRAAKKAGKK